MSERRLSLHRALAELKLITSKIDKKMEGLVAVDVKTQNNSLLLSKNTTESFKTSVTSTVQSVQELIKNKTILKTAIVKANAETVVTIGGQEMTIADAITNKDYISHKKEFISVLKSSYMAATRKTNSVNDTVELKADTLINSASNADNKDDDFLINLRKRYMDENSVELFDPANIKELIDDLENEVDTFMSEVDAVLSEANATTFIDLE